MGLALLLAVVCVVIMMVNSNVGAGVAVAGVFSLARFLSAPEKQVDFPPDAALQFIARPAIMWYVFYARFPPGPVYCYFYCYTRWIQLTNHPILWCNKEKRAALARPYL